MLAADDLRAAAAVGSHGEMLGKQNNGRGVIRRSVMSHGVIEGATVEPECHC